MTITEYTAYREDEILPLYADAGWTAYTDDPAALREGFARSLLVLAAYEGGELLGIRWATGARSCSSRTFWCSRGISARGWARPCCGRC